MTGFFAFSFWPLAIGNSQTAGKKLQASSGTAAASCWLLV
jgi:hypothetical protein